MLQITRRPKLWLCLCRLTVLVALRLSAVFLGKSPIRAKFDQIRIGMDEKEICEITQQSHCIIAYTCNRPHLELLLEPLYDTYEELQRRNDTEGWIYVSIDDEGKVESKSLWEPSADQRMRRFFKIVRDKIGIGR